MRAFVFDLDGTLLDTLGDLGGACNAVLARHGYPQHPRAAYAKMVGCGFATLVRRALPQRRLPDAAEQARLLEEAGAYYSQHMTDATVPYAGIPETLEELARANCILAVLSNKPDEMTVPIIRHFFPQIPFAVIQGARADIPLKPDPASLLDLLKSLQIPKEAAFYVGDSDVDMQTAKNAEVAGIGVAWGFRGARELAQAGAFRIVDKPAQLLELA